MCWLILTEAINRRPYSLVLLDEVEIRGDGVALSFEDGKPVD
jgi:hypothetical protein